MKPLKTFFVRPNLPERLAVLEELAFNMRWTWDADARELFRRIDPELWDSTGHNPVRVLGELDAARYQSLLEDESFLFQLDRVEKEFREYMDPAGSWFAKAHPDGNGPIVAYFSAEFGIADCVPIFSGGLGVLAGDHLKSASDMGVPIVGVGLLYQSGYFRQYLNPEGWQQETYPVSDFHVMPILRVKQASGEHLAISVPFPGRIVKAFVWKAHVGRNPLYLLDTNHPDNSEWDRKITGQLYGGDQETRIQQEIVLGMGGVVMLEALGLTPAIYHSNEGHAAFLTLEIARQLVRKHGISFQAACEACKGRVVFTTHTPVPAGIDVFPRELVERFFGGYVKDVGISMEDLLHMGRLSGAEFATGFNMAVLAVGMSYGTNAVSRLHEITSKKMWCGLWPGIPFGTIPIGHVTNGIHIPTWISADMGSLFDRYLGPRWREDPRDRQLWGRVDRIPMAEIWRTHERRRERLVAFARSRIAAMLMRQRGEGRSIEAAGEILNPETLTIGFARRFAPYKRANLLLRDPDRLVRILTARDRPVQIIFAGKAHPRDEQGKSLIRNIVAASKRPELADRIVFIEDYDLNIARYLVQGVDVWLNTPRRPREASGTSGMKAVANGALHVSTQDGWWAEVNSEGLGWTIGAGEEYGDDQHDYWDNVESRALYDLLEHEVVPLFYQRGADGLPRGWVQRMKTSMKELCPTFNSNRMVRQYTEQYYLPARAHSERICRTDLDGARRLADWRRVVTENWGRLKLVGVEADLAEETVVGATGRVKAWLESAPLLPQDIAIEVVYGRIREDFQIQETGAVPMRYVSTDANNRNLFEGIVPCIMGGKMGFAIRILPRHRDLPNPYQMGLVRIFEA
jgi:starch phosphorylase